ncbi:MAG: hypothetical protein MI808_09465 [Pseudomonadales bacterium]|nr:hypothetical protein [Pseudomonadales bacterium]
MSLNNAIKCNLAFFALVVLSACDRTDTLSADWVNRSLPSPSEEYISSIASNDDGSVSVALSREHLYWLDDDGELTKISNVEFDNNLIGPNQIVRNINTLIQRNNGWALQGRLELSNGTYVLVVSDLDFSNQSIKPYSVAFELPEHDRVFELDNGNWLILDVLTSNNDTRPVEVLELTENGLLVNQFLVDFINTNLNFPATYWIANGNQLRVGSKQGIYAIEDGLVIPLWEAETYCQSTESFFSDSVGVPVLNSTGEAILGCGNNNLVRITGEGDVIHYPVEFPSNATTLIESNFIAEPNGDLWLAVQYSPVACNEDGSCSGVLADMRGFIHRYSYSGQLLVDTNESINQLGFIGTAPNAFLLADGSPLFIVQKGEGGYTHVNKAGVPDWTAHIPGSFLSLYTIGSAHLSAGGFLFLLSSEEQELYRFDSN